MTTRMPPLTMRFRIREGTAPKLMSRVADALGANLLTASISAIKYNVYTITSGLSQPVLKAGPTALTVSSVWFDTLQTDDGWTSDTVGYNFAAVLPASIFTGLASAIRGQQYKVEIRGTPVSGELFPIMDAIIEVSDWLSVGT